MTRHIEGKVADEHLFAASAALKALSTGQATPEQQVRAYRWIVDVVACTDRQEFAMPGDSETMAWRNGRRFVGLEIERIVLAPIQDAGTPEPLPRTITGQVRRRGRGEQ